MGKQRIPASLFVLGASIFLSLASLIALLIALPAQMDAASKAREQRLISNGIRGIIAEVAASVVPQTSWDDAVAHLDNKFDPAWAADNIGKYFYATDGFDYSAVIGADAQPLFFSNQGVPSAPKRAHALLAIAQPMIEDVRRGETKRGPVQKRDDGAFLTKPIQAFSLCRFNGRIYVVVAALVQPDFGTAMPSARAPIVITAKEVAAPTIEAIARRFLLADAKLQRGFGEPEKRAAHALLRDYSGAVIGSLDWTPQTPGKKLAGQLAPLALFILFAILAIGALAYRRLMKSALDLINSEANAVFIATHDLVTGLYKRRYFQEQLSAALGDARDGGAPFAVVTIDIDDIKSVNDTFGHSGGDQFIAAQAARLKEAADDAELLARTGSDEFTFILRGVTPEDTQGIVGALLKTLSAPVDLPCGRVAATCSAGIWFSAEGAGIADCLTNLEFALRTAKVKGGGALAIYSGDLAKVQNQRLGLLRDLKADLARGALSVVYQPQGDLNDCLVGVESLVRWTHAVHGPISPDLFVALAEESDLIDELGFFVMRRAFQDSRRWPGLKIAINVSARQLRIPGFMDRVNAMLIETRVDASRFEIEITERLIMTDDQHTHDVLHELNDYGFSIALDDFGAGYSNLGYLRRFPIEKIKIDKAFIDGLGVDAGAQMLVSAITQLAHALKLGVVGEGVENHEQRRLLAEAGCSIIQGYLFSKPLTADQLDPFWRTHAPQPAQRRLGIV